jgi:hypothetical protein
LSWREAAALIMHARRAGVMLTVGADGKLGWKADRPPSDDLLATLKQHKVDILALLPQPPCASLAVEHAKRLVLRLEALGFRPFLDEGALMIADAAGKGRDLSRYLSIGEVFDTLVAGLADNSELLDEEDERTP